MILDYERFRPIQTFGIILMCIGIFGCLTVITQWSNPEIFRSAWIFVLTMTIWHLLTGVGILLKKGWGFYLLKFYVYALYLAVPIGTLLAKRMLEYIRVNDIQRFFFGHRLEL